MQSCSGKMKRLEASMKSSLCSGHSSASFGNPEQHSIPSSDWSNATTPIICGRQKRRTIFCELATDTYVVKEGKIVTQSFIAKITPKREQASESDDRI